MILDGFGISLEKAGNPVAEASTPAIDDLERNFPFVSLQASGVAVGLPWGVPGNSEVGHLTIGAGRVIYHHLPRIIYSIYDGSFFSNEALVKAAEHARDNHSQFHIAGLVSSGSVHSYIDHLYALLDFTKKQNISPVYLHIVTDGKDSPPQEAKEFLSSLQERINKEWPHVRFASLIGRSFALDRDENWARTQETYALLTQGEGEKIDSISSYLKRSYQEGITDDFVKPAALTDERGEPVALIKDNDALIFSDFREDSMRQISRAFAQDQFSAFPRKKVENLLTVTMTEYLPGLNAFSAFPRLDIDWPIARVLGESGLSHLHIAETQKYAHISYFLNGGRENLFPREDRILIPSIPTAHFDEIPQMRTPEITASILEHFNDYDVIIANFANADMVGHSGNFHAAIQAVEAIDVALNKIMNAVLERGGMALITADHGNIELKRNILSGEKLTKHSINLVPLYLVGKNLTRSAPREEKEIAQIKKGAYGILTDIAPTMIELLGLKKPLEMTGQSLVSALFKR